MAEIAGLKLITPTSVAGSGVSLSGAKVLFTAATSINVNGCFTSTYDNYLVVFQSEASSTPNLQMRMRASGTDATGSNYTTQRVGASDTSIFSGRDVSLDYARIAAPRSGRPQGMHLYVYGPNLAQPTAARSLSDQNVSGIVLIDFAWTHSLSTSYDGMTIYPSSGDITGAFTIYGLSQ